MSEPLTFSPLTRAHSAAAVLVVETSGTLSFSLSLVLAPAALAYTSAQNRSSLGCARTCALCSSFAKFLWWYRYTSVPRGLGTKKETQQQRVCVYTSAPLLLSTTRASSSSLRRRGAGPRRVREVSASVYCKRGASRVRAIDVGLFNCVKILSCGRNLCELLTMEGWIQVFSEKLAKGWASQLMWTADARSTCVFVHLSGFPCCVIWRLMLLDPRGKN